MTQRRFILGTAGHVDHGKTELVSRLTGWDTDRLKEEKERGISIELGFAPLVLDEETTVGIVDVPGHERFVKHMVAGAGGIDLAILVIAGDEGVMPQTKEHLEVLRSLAVAHGIIVISKQDLVTDDMRPIVEEDVAELVRGSFLEDAPLVYTSAKTGDGIDELKSAIKNLSNRIPERDTGGLFRLAVDRVFHKQGIGVVVTGSCYSGTISIGDTLELLPSDRPVRVRGIQSFGEKRENGYAGERLAIALQGGKLGEVMRGDMLVTPKGFAVSYMLDARIQIAAYAAFELKQRERVRLHHGAREVLGRVALLERDKLQSGDSGLVQFRLETPVVGGEGDFFVVRKYSPSRVLGGGRIIDPHPDKHRARDTNVLAHLKLQEEGAPTDRVGDLVLTSGSGGVGIKDLDPDTARILLDEGTLVAIDKRVFHRDVLQALGQSIETATKTYVTQHPLRRGVDKEELRQRIAFPHATPVFNRVLDWLSDTHAIAVHDNRVEPAGGPVVISRDLQHNLDALRNVYEQAGLFFLKNDEAQKNWRGNPALFNDALQYFRDGDAIIKLNDEAHVSATAMQECLVGLRNWFGKNDQLLVSDFKTLFGVTRKHAIPILEYTDQQRLTTRRENARLRGPRLAPTD